MSKKRGAKGDGWLEKRGQIYRICWTVDGKTMTKSTGESDKEKAQAVGVKIIEEWKALQQPEILKAKLIAAEGKVDVILDDNALKIEDAWQAYIDTDNNIHTSKITMTGYNCHWNKLVNWLKAAHPEIAQLRQIDTPIAKQFCKAVLDSSSPNTYNKHITFYRAMWKALKEEARLDANPWESIKKKLLDTFTRRELTVEELAKVCGKVKGEMRLLFAVGIYTGLRLNDAVHLDWTQVDLVRKVISLIPRKTKKHNGRVRIAIHPVLEGIINEECANAEHKGFLMPELAAKYDKTGANNVSHKIQAVFESCGIATTVKKDGNQRAAVEVGFHSLRHTFVSICANGGVPMAVVQSIVGHSNPSMTEHYFHVSDKALNEAMSALPSIGLANTQAKEENAPEAILGRFNAIVKELEDNGLMERALKMLKARYSKKPLKIS